MRPGQVLSDAQAREMALARSQLSPLLTQPNGPNADMAHALLGYSAQRGQRDATARQIGNMATVLMQGGGRRPADAYMQELAAQLSGPRR